MTISYPLALPSVGGLKRISFQERNAVGMSESPFTFVQQTYEHQGDGWGAVMEFAEMERAEAEDWIGWRLSLGGRHGTFLMGDPVDIAPRGTWSGASPVVYGAHAAMAKTLTIGGVDGLTWKRGDWLQVGSGSSSRLHKVTQDGVQVGSPQTGQIEIWPRLRDALANGAAVVISSPKGLWRLAANAGEWTIDPDSPFILPPLSVVEAR